MDSKLACGRVSKLLHEIAIDLGLNLIVKISILLQWIYFTLRIARSNPSQIFTLEQLVLSVFLGHFEAQQQEEAQQYGQRRVSGWLEEPLSLDGRSSGSQAHKVHKWALRKANGPKGAQKKKQKTHGHYVLQQSKNGPQQA